MRKGRGPEFLERIKRPLATWTREDWTHFSLFVLYFLGPLLAYWLGKPSVSNAIYWLTGFVVLVYTIETHWIRVEMVRQNEIATRPLVVTKIGWGQGAYGALREIVMLRNIGRGPALFAKIEDVDFGEIDALGQLVAQFEASDIIEEKQEVDAKSVISLKDQQGQLKPVQAIRDLVPLVKPQSASHTVEVRITYEDANQQSYESVMQMGKGGIRLLRHGKLAAA